MKGQNTHMLESFAQVCETVQSMHNRHITHGDLHYENIILDINDDNVETKVIDFGSSKVRHFSEMLLEQNWDNLHLTTVASTFIPFLQPGHQATYKFIEMLQRYPPPKAEQLARAARKAMVNPDRIYHKYEPMEPDYFETW